MKTTEQEAIVKWHKPEETPSVTKGESKEFWIATERKDRNGKLTTSVTCAQYTNMPVNFDDNGEPDTDYHLVSEDGEAISAVGWHSVKNHYDFDDYYEPLSFDDSYKLLGWANYIKPKFK